GLDLFEGFAVTPSSWDIYWAYCQTGALVDVYDEGVSGRPIYSVPGTGTCTTGPGPLSATASLPAFSIPSPAPIAGYTITGALTLAATGSGTIMLAGAPAPLRVFGTVDCTTACGSPGWTEL